MRPPSPPLSTFIICIAFAISTILTTASAQTPIAFQRPESPHVLMGRIKLSRAPDIHHVISQTFEEFAIVEPNEADPMGRRWTAQRGPETSEERLFSAPLPSGLIQLPNDYYLTVLSDYLAFESIPYVFALWQARGDSLIFRGFLDDYISVSMATLQIDEVISLSSNESLIKGSAGGGDAGDINGTLWFAYWRHPLEFILVYRKDWDRCHLEPDVEVRLMHDFDTTTLHLKVELQERRALRGGAGYDRGEKAPEYSSWQNRAVDHVDLGTLLRVTAREDK